MATKEYKLDIFDLLNKLNSKSAGDIYSKLSDEEKKGFAPLIVMAWMSGTSDERQIILLNEFVNSYVFTLAKHPHLLMQLLQVASSKTPKRYQWMSVKNKAKKAQTLKVIQEYFDMSERESKLMSPQPTPEELISMAEELGWQSDEMNVLKKELKDV